MSDSTITVTDRKSASASLNQFCTFSMADRQTKGDFLEVIEWGNMEGVDVRISDVTGEHNFQLTHGQYQALTQCYDKLHSEKDWEKFYEDIRTEAEN